MDDAPKQLLTTTSDKVEEEALWLVNLIRYKSVWSDVFISPVMGVYIAHRGLPPGEGGVDIIRSMLSCP